MDRNLRKIYMNIAVLLFVCIFSFPNISFAASKTFNPVKIMGELLGFVIIIYVINKIRGK